MKIKNLLFITITLLGCGNLTDEDIKKRIFYMEYSRAIQLESFDLRNFLKSENDEIRKNAVIALGKIQDTTSIPEIAKTLYDKNTEIRKESAFALGQMFNKSSENFLLSVFKNETDRGVKLKIIEALGKTSTEKSFELLREMLNDKDPDFRSASALASGISAYRNVKDTPAVPILSKLLNDENSEVRWKSAYAIFRMGHKSAIETVIEKILKSETIEENEAINLARYLTKIRDEKSVPALLKLLKNSDWRIRVEVMKALSFIKTNQVRDVILESLKDKNEHVRLTAVESLKNFNDEKIISKLRELLKDSTDWRIQGTSAMVLAELIGASVIDDILKIKPSDNWRLEAKLIEALGRTKDPKVITNLAAVYSFARFELKRPALASLSGIEFTAKAQEEIAHRMASEALNFRDNALVSTSAEICAEKKLVKNIPKLMKAYKKFKSPQDTETLTAIITSLDTLWNYSKDKKIISFFEETVFDNDKNVSGASQRALKRITGKSPIIKHSPYYTAGNIDFSYIKNLAETSKAIIKTNKGEIVIKLFHEDAPANVANFCKLAKNNHFNGIVFHRVVPDFVIQGGDPDGTGYGGPGYAIPCEYNHHTYKRGMVGMALAGKDTGGSQFFITHSPQPHLDGRYTIFGEVIKGMEVVDEIQVGDVIEKVEIVY